MGDTGFELMIPFRNPAQNAQRIAFCTAETILPCEGSLKTKAVFWAILDSNQ